MRVCDGDVCACVWLCGVLRLYIYVRVYVTGSVYNIIRCR